MKKILSLTLTFLSFNLFAESGTLQGLSGSEIDFTSKIQVQKQITLDNPFVIQLYSNWKSLSTNDALTNSWVEATLNKDFEKALGLVSNLKISNNDLKLKSMVDATELYLHFELGHYQTFLSRWIDISSSSNFLKSEMGIAIDQIIGEKSTKILIENGFYLSSDRLKNLTKIEAIPSRMNYSLQAFKALRTRENAVVWIGKLSETDPLRIPLAETAILHYSKDGKLGASGKILKSVIEPILSKSNDEEELSLYFMTLGRLLYKANALTEARKYFDLIPESSSYFLEAKSEALWIHIREKDLSRAKGDLASLELKVFDDKFYPEAYLVSAMANIMLCQFKESKNSISRFIEVNKKWAQEITKNLNNPDALPVKNNFFLTNLEHAKASITKEQKWFDSKKLNPVYLSTLNDDLAAINVVEKKEINNQWQNKKVLLESALYKMKFAKIELISRMRQVENNMMIADMDEVHDQKAATAKNNQIKFPTDRTIWGDELFHMSASVKNKCMQGNK
jgi:hypothetical protein